VCMCLSAETEKPSNSNQYKQLKLFFRTHYRFVYTGSTLREERLLTSSVFYGCRIFRVEAVSYFLLTCAIQCPVLLRLLVTENLKSGESVAGHS